MTEMMTGGAPVNSAPNNPFHQPAPAAPEGPVFEGPAGETGTFEGPVEVGEVGIAVPGIIVLDCSWSMAGDLARASAALEKFRTKLRQHPMAGSNAHLGIVTFADTARTELDLCRVADTTIVVPQFGARGNGTNFDAAFAQTLTAFRAGLPLIGTTADGRQRQVFRPSVYFVSDGEHNTGPDWRARLAELKSRSWKPNVFAFGYRDAEADTIREIADEGLAYFAEQGQDPDQMFEQILQVILRSVISATTTAQALAADPTAPVAVAPVDPKTDPATAGLARFDPIGSTID